MTSFDDFNALISGHARPIILIEGTREVPEEDLPRLTAFAKRLAERYPHALFRTGNAPGSDEAFARGIQAVDESRLEYIVPYTTHRLKPGASSARRVALSDLPHVDEDQAAYQTAQASPKYNSLIEKRHKNPTIKAKAAYLIRDTVKVMGSETPTLGKATFGIFYVTPSDPMKGGTGHTIRVCHILGVPIAFQNEWMQWAQK